MDPVPVIGIHPLRMLVARLFRRRHGAEKGVRSIPLAYPSQGVEVPRFASVVVAHLWLFRSQQMGQRWLS